MCGIVGYVGKKAVVPVIIEGLRKLEYRRNFLWKGKEKRGVIRLLRKKLEIRASPGVLCSLCLQKCQDEKNPKQ